MKVVVIYDSAFGNTERVAKAMGAALVQRSEVEVFRATEIKPEQLKGANLVIVGSPTQGFRPLESIRTFLESLPGDALKGMDAAVFDTRVDAQEINAGLRFMVKLGGYAAKRMAETVKKKGGNLIIQPEGFFVKDQKGPLKEGELERATQWAKEIAEKQKAQKVSG